MTVWEWCSQRVTSWWSWWTTTVASCGLEVSRNRGRGHSSLLLCPRSHVRSVLHLALLFYLHNTCVSLKLLLMADFFYCIQHIFLTFIMKKSSKEPCKIVFNLFIGSNKRIMLLLLWGGIFSLLIKQYSVLQFLLYIYIYCISGFMDSLLPCFGEDSLLAQPRFCWRCDGASSWIWKPTTHNPQMCGEGAGRWWPVGYWLLLCPVCLHGLQWWEARIHPCFWVLARYRLAIDWLHPLSVVYFLGLP